MSVRDRADRAGNQPGDSALGLNARICRRDFLNSTLLASGRFTELFSSAGFDPRKDIAGIILNRWGHHFVAPQPGFMYGKDGKPPPREILREKPFGRIAFAHTDLTGHSGHNLSIEEGHRAVMQLLPVL